MMSYLGSFNGNRYQHPLTIDEIGRYIAAAQRTRWAKVRKANKAA